MNLNSSFMPEANFTPLTQKKSKGGLGSLREFVEHNGECTAIKISADNFGYNAENRILTIPHYAVFLLA